jgi:glycosyltransferase involved in cell wall biosynthesis
MSISLIIPCYNARRWIEEAIRSACQPCAQQVEILVIDDGSDDGSAELVRGRFPQARVVTTPNRGVSAARNLGISLATGEFFVFLDADDVLAPGKLDRQVALQRATGADVVYGDWQKLCPDSEGHDQPAEVVHRALEGDAQIALFTGFWCPTGAYLFTRRIVERVGGFRPQLPVIQDARFALDCALHGGSFVHDAAIAVLYRVHTEGSVSTRSRTAFLHDCLTNIIEVHAWWQARQELTPLRREAVTDMLQHVAVGSCGLAPALFWEACRQLEQIAPGYIPPRRASVRALSRLLGYPRAEMLLSATRPWRDRMRRWLGRARAITR